MSLKASISQEGDITILEIHGKLNFDNQVEIQRSISEVMQKGKQVVVDLNGLDFIGSSGVTNFIQMIKDMSTTYGTKPRFCNVSREFSKLMHAFNIEKESIHLSKNDAISSFFRTADNERH